MIYHVIWKIISKFIIICEKDRKLLLRGEFFFNVIIYYMEIVFEEISPLLVQKFEIISSKDILKLVVKLKLSLQKTTFYSTSLNWL